MALNNPFRGSTVTESQHTNDIVSFVKVSKIIKKNGVNVKVTQREPVTRQKYFDKQITSEPFDLAEQLSAGVDLKEVSFNLNTIDPATRERIYAKAGAKLFNELSHLHSKESEEKASSSVDQPSDPTVDN